MGVCAHGRLFLERGFFTGAKLSVSGRSPQQASETLLRLRRKQERKERFFKREKEKKGNSGYYTVTAYYRVLLGDQQKKIPGGFGNFLL
jgi:hypothetical protein